MKSDDFEQQLQQQAPRIIPATWRAEILDSARASASPRRALPAPQSTGWREWVWPHPQAWGALAAVWIVILAIHSNTPGSAAVDREMQAAVPMNTMIAFAEQRKLLSEVLDPASNVIAEPPKTPAPRRRSETPSAFLTA